MYKHLQALPFRFVTFYCGFNSPRSSKEEDKGRRGEIKMNLTIGV